MACTLPNRSDPAGNSRPLRRSLPETDRFLEHSSRHKQKSLSQTIQPVISLVRAYPGRFFILGAVILLVSFASEAALFFDPHLLARSSQLATMAGHSSHDRGGSGVHLRQRSHRSVG